MRFNGRMVKCLLLSALLAGGCGFNPGEAAPPTGSASSGNGGNTGVGASPGSGNGANTGAGAQTGAGGDVGPGAGGSCGQTDVPIEALPPDVLIVQDKSGSMAEDDSGSSCGNRGCGANSKWSQMSAALTSVVTSTASQINWGLKFFSDDGVCGGSADPVVTIGGGAGNGNAIANAITMTSPAGNTPTRDAVTTGAAYLAGVQDNNPKYILLATDGLPNCPAGCAGMRNVSGNCTMTDNPSEDQAVTQAIASALSASHIKTFVIGVGNVSTAQNTLNDFAMAGGLAQTGAATSYYAATDPQALENALKALVGAVFSCTVSLAGAPSNFTNVAVSATDTSSGSRVAIPQDSSNGWSYDANKQNILLNGDACNKLKNMQYTDLNFTYACDGTVICIDRNQDGTCLSHT
jgi:hypothetical protein